MFKFVVLSALVACALGAAIPDGLLPQLDGRIVGGTQTSIDQYPYQVSLQRNGAHFCGGSVYSNSIVITAAHCTQNVAARALKVRAGSTSRASGGSLVNVATIIVHPNYSSSTMSNDITIIKLASPLTLGTNIKAIPLASVAPAAGAAAVVSGWGTTSSGGSSGNILRAVGVNIISRAQCSSSPYGYSATEITDTMICARGSGKDSCQGDSGGPLASGGVLVGVVSWGYGCADPRFPGVYTDVAAVNSWVTSNV